MGILACFGLPNVRQLQRQLAEQRASNESLEQQLAAIVQARTADKAEKTALEHAKRTAEEQLSCTEAKLAQVLINARSVITDRKQLQGKVRMLEKQKEVLMSTLNNQCTISEKEAEEQQKIYAAEVALLHHAAVHATQETAQRESELKDARRSRQRLARELAKARARVEQLEAEAAQHEQLQRDSLQAQLKNLDEREVAVRAEKVAVLVLAEAEAQNMQLQEKLDTKTRKLVESGMELQRVKDVGGKLLRKMEASMEEQRVQLRAQTTQLEQLQAQLHDQTAQLQQLQGQLHAQTEQLQWAALQSQELGNVGMQLLQQKQLLEQALLSATATPTISEEHFPSVKRLGSGAFATVDAHEMRLAVKKASTEFDAQLLAREEAIMNSMDHEAILKVSYLVQGKDSAYLGLGMELLSHGTLADAIWPSKGGEGKWRSPFAQPSMLLQMQWMLQLVDVVSYIHSFGRVHADLKADNIMLRENGRIVLNDWGLSYLVSETACKTGYRGTLGHFRPAMVLDYQANMGPDDDLYGLCATAWEMLHKGEPLGDALMRQYSGTLCNPAIREQITAACHACHQDTTDSTVRVVVAQMLGHVGLTQADFAPYLEDPSVPRRYVELLQRGLSLEAARGRAPMPTLQEFGDVLREEIKKLALSQILPAAHQGSA